METQVFAVLKPGIFHSQWGEHMPAPGKISIGGLITALFTAGLGIAAYISTPASTYRNLNLLYVVGAFGLTVVVFVVRNFYGQIPFGRGIIAWAGAMLTGFLLGGALEETKNADGGVFSFFLLALILGYPLLRIGLRKPVSPTQED